MTSLPDPATPPRRRGVTYRAWWALLAGIVALVVLIQWRHYPWQLAMMVSLGVTLVTYAGILAVERQPYFYRRHR